MRMQFMRRSTFFGNLVVAILTGAVLVSVAFNALARIDEPPHGHAEPQYLVYGGHSFDREPSAFSNKRRSLALSLMALSEKEGEPRHRSPPESGILVRLPPSARNVSVADRGRYVVVAGGRCFSPEHCGE
jgi:hypothetical protein